MPFERKCFKNKVLALAIIRLNLTAQARKTIHANILLNVWMSIHTKVLSCVMLNAHSRLSSGTSISTLSLIWRELQRNSTFAIKKLKTHCLLALSSGICEQTVSNSSKGRCPDHQIDRLPLSAINNRIKMKQMQKEQMAKTSSANFTVAVEGNIGSGKSTLLKHFEKLPYCEVIGEPVDQWTNLEGHNALGLLYDDQERWSFSFNMYAQLTRIDMHLKPHTTPVKMLERSLYSTRYCFVQNNYLNKTINGFEFSVFSQWFDYLTSSGKADVDLIVYLRADPSTCYERLRKRSRKEEAGVPMSLIESLHKLHDEWLLEKKYPVPAPVLVLDANYDLDKMQEVYDSRRQEILCGYS